jgi:hypothetical protein
MSREIYKKCNYFAIIFMRCKCILLYNMRRIGNKKAPSLGLKLASDLALAPYFADGVRLCSLRHQTGIDQQLGQLWPRQRTRAVAGQVDPVHHVLRDGDLMRARLSGEAFDFGEPLAFGQTCGL